MLSVHMYNPQLSHATGVSVSFNVKFKDEVAEETFKEFIHQFDAKPLINGIHNVSYLPMWEVRGHLVKAIVATTADALMMKAMLDIVNLQPLTNAVTIDYLC